VVATSVTDEGKKKTYKSHRSKPDCTKLPLVVLVNGRSASSSEIVAACMQDLKRGLLIGRPTFGKGVGQSITSLIDGSGVKVTTTRFYSPTGRSVDGKGLKPDISCASSRDVAVAIRQLTAELEGQ
jgi:carboxyl-terminal processing protease